MAKNVELNVDIEVKSNVEPSIKKLKELKQQLKNVAAGSNEFKEISAQIRDTEDALDGAKKGADDFMGALENADGPLGMAARGLKSLQIQFSTFNGALRASVIGLIVTALGGLVAAFSSNEKAMKKLEPIMIQFEKLLGGIFAAIEPVFDIFVDLAIKAMPLVTDAVKIVYSGLSTLLQTIGKVGSAIAKVFSGDFKGAFEDAKSSILDVGKTYDKTAKAFDKGASEMSKTEKKNAEEQDKIRKENAEKAAKAAADALALRKADLEAKIKLETDAENTSKEKLTALYEERFQAEIKGQKMTDAQKQVLRDENTKKVEEALKADKDARQKVFDEELKQLQEAGKLQISQLDANYNEAKTIYGENSKEARLAQDEIFNAQLKSLQDEKDILNQKKELTDAEVLRLKYIAIEQQNLTTTVKAENQKRIESDVAAFLKKQEEQKKTDDAAYAQKMKAAADDFDLQQEILDAKIEQDKLFYENILAQENLTAEQKAAIETQFTETKRANAEAQMAIDNAVYANTQARLTETSNALSQLAELVGKQTVAGKALGIATALINTYQGASEVIKQKSVLPSPFDVAAKVIGVATTVAAGLKTVQQITSVNVPTETGGGGTPSGGGGGISVPKPRGLARGGFVSGPGSGTSDSIPALLSNGESVINASSTAMFKPLLSTINAIGGGRRFASGGIVSKDISSQAMNELSNSLGGMTSPEPVKTYVVARDITNQQMMDRAIKSRSTI